MEKSEEYVALGVSGTAVDVVACAGAGVVEEVVVGWLVVVVVGIGVVDVVVVVVVPIVFFLEKPAMTIKNSPENSPDIASRLYICKIYYYIMVRKKSTRRQRSYFSFIWNSLQCAHRIFYNVPITHIIVIK